MEDNEANPTDYQPLIDQPPADSSPSQEQQHDFNNPPLRRMRTSLVNRRRMAEMQEREVCKKYYDKQVSELLTNMIIIAFLTFSYYMPSIFGGERSENCQMRTGFANAMFGWVLCGAFAVMHLAFIIGYHCKKGQSSQSLKEWVEASVLKTTVASFLIQAIGYTVFFFWTQVLWSQLSSGDCMSGYNLYDFMIWLCILFITVWTAIAVSFLLLICVCCAPCIYSAVREYIAQQANSQAERNGVIDAIIARKYNSEDFKAHSECAICMMAFEEDEEVTPLPCNPGHYFHSPCITQWLKEKNTCPICRATVDAKGFEDLQSRLDAEDQNPEQI